MLKVTEIVVRIHAKVFHNYTAQHNLFSPLWTIVVIALILFVVQLLYFFVLFKILSTVFPLLMRSLFDFLRFFFSCYFPLFYFLFARNFVFSVQIYKSQKHGNLSVIENKLTGNFVHIYVCCKYTLRRHSVFIQLSLKV